MYYILNADKTVSKVEYALEWAKQFEFLQDQRIVALTIVPYKGRVSTVFLGIDHNWGDGPPILFETMVFSGPFDQEQLRYRAYDEALRGHEMVVKMVKSVPLWKFGLWWISSLPALVRKFYKRASLKR